MSRPIPASWYVDPQVLEAERRTLFANAPRYAGSLPMVPEHGSYHTLATEDHAEMLVRDHDDVLLLGNRCLHRGLQMLHGAGRTRQILCSMHRWAYDLRGNVVSAPFYPETPCVHLPRRPLRNWNGLLFAGNRDVHRELAPLAGRPELDMRDYRLVHYEEEEQPFNWKIPIEVLLENYHAPFIHPGFNRFCAPSAWYGNEGAYDSEELMFQELKPHPDFDRNPASPVFERWQHAILELTGGTPPPFAAIIGLYSPNVIIEWWPFVFDVTTYVPRTPDRSLMVREFYFDPGALERIPGYAEIVHEAWYETQRADDDAHERFQRGRTAVWRNDPEAPMGYEVFQSPMEESVELFHAMLLREVGAELKRMKAPVPMAP